MSPLPNPKDERPINVGDRFTSRDWRDSGRTVEVRAVLADGTRFKVQNETHPVNPSAVGRHSIIGEHNLRTRWARVSR